MKRRAIQGWALLALAGAAGAAAAENNLFAGDVGNAFWTVLIFVVLLWVLGRFAWGPLLGVLQSREKFIRESLESARRERQQAEARLREYEEKLTAARAEATEIVEEGRRDAEETARRVQAQARAEADQMIDRARREIEIAKQTAIRELNDHGAELATRIAARIVERELDAADHERLISQALDELGRLEN